MATERVLQRAGLQLRDIDAFEVNEAFACVVLAWLQATGVDPALVNPLGGAIAFGHPRGTSGGRLLGSSWPRSSAPAAATGCRRGVKRAGSPTP
ncbi:hypothetical protein ACNUCX_11335 [Curtobacterium flaccumfaciens pv. flaccumfaciens]|uniref:hypothetical protein n=1 Tax=Curtobacterium flaccumfaciens TaxID=2035 RepID=UPI003AB36544